ncbi:MAG: cell wall-binding repeat-containing protein [Firmicutes bacterium]|nr:cell wall-binding repeat-containing protein [Bacillota bacterium]
MTTCITYMPSMTFVTETAAGAPAAEAPVSDAANPEAEDAQVSQPESPAAEASDDVKLNTADANAPVGMTAKVGKSEITVTINKVGTSGTAQLYRYGANEYNTSDSMRGLSKDVLAQGEYIADYTCGSSQDIVFNRYLNDGSDNLYSKYYLVQNGKILVGPVYATQIDSLRSNGRFEGSKKGLTNEEDFESVEMAKEMGAGNTVVNININELILANEDENGNKIDHSRNPNAIEFESNGEMFYFNADYVRSRDAFISAYSKAGINVSLVIISWMKTYQGSGSPSALLYMPYSENRHTMAFNTSTDRGVDYWVAAMEFLANRYSKSAKQGLAQQFVIGNEIDYTYDWSLIEPLKKNGKYNRTPVDTFMEEYSRGLRLANLAVKKYNSEAKVCISLTHNWAENCLASYGYGKNDTSQIRYNSYAPKELLDWLVKYEGARGDYDWGIAAHPYPIGTTSSNPVVTDPDPSKLGSAAHGVTGDWKTSPWVTVANLEVYQMYLQQPENMYNGEEIRKVYLTETSICNLDRNKNSAAAVEKSQNEAAASIAMTYYRAANLECIDSIDYFQLHDQEGEISNKLGLLETSGRKKPAYNVWKYIDTNKSFTYANKYLKYIAPNATSYKDLMQTVTTKETFNWDAYWNEENIMVRDLGSTEVQRSLVTNKETYSADEQILTTAVGYESDVVGLYKATDDVSKVDPIYSYTIGSGSGTISTKSGGTYDLLAYGTISSSRSADAQLKAGDYKVVLKHGDTDEYSAPAPVSIKINGDYSIGGTSTSLKTDKKTYNMGEAVVVSATGGTSTAWVGLYKKGDKYGPGEVTSIYWYYINDTANGIIPGKPTVLQNTTHNGDSSNPAAKLAAGDYVVYLFQDSGYTSIKSVEFTVEGSANIEPLLSVDYKLDNDKDGFANGVVTVKKNAANEDATDCIMYWADADGNKLEGYTALAKFKLKGSVTNFEMYDYTIIPEGAKTLIAYATDGVTLSESYVSVKLPEGCNYTLEDDYLAEFQIISDVHVTRDQDQKGEVKISNQHFSQMLEDVKLNSPESIGIFINGDIANSGKEAEYKKVFELYNRAKYSGNGDLPGLHISIGNHDWMAGNPNKQFQKYAQILNGDMEQQPEKVYYHETVAGYDFIYLGGEAAGLGAALSDEQLEWFDETMAEITAKDPNKPVFVLLHQGVYNTVAGTLPGQGWDGVPREAALKKVLKKYGQIIMVSGHSHWELNSESNMYPGDEDMSVALNTASVGYLWTSYNIDGGEFQDGSNGYYVRVYDDKVVFMGREFETSEWVSSAQIVVQKNGITTSKDEYTIAADAKALNLDAKAANGAEIDYTSTNRNVATVTADGTVIPKKAGTTEIVMTALGDETTVVNRKRVTVNVTDGAVERFYGSNRYATAYKTADALKEELGVEKFDSVIIASGTNFADALAGSYLAAKEEAPILLAGAADSDIKELQNYIKANLKKDGTVYLLGGPKAVDNKVANGLTNCTVQRIAGSDRYATNLEILKKAGVKKEDVLVCTGMNFADSLSASASERPILLVGSSLNAEQNAYLKTLSGNKYYVIGGEKAVVPAVEKQLKVYGDVERLAGQSRYETSVLVAKEFFKDPDCAVLAYGMNFPDGLCGGPLAVSMEGPLILTATGSESEAVKYAKEEGIKSGTVLGGTGLISDKAVKAIFQMDDATHIVVR